MNCRQFQNDCSAYIDGALAPERCAALKAHLDTCADCQKHVAQLDQLGTGLAALPQMQPPPRFLNEVRRKINQPTPVAQPDWVEWLFRPLWLKLPAEALAVIAVLVTVIVLTRPPARTPERAQPVTAAPVAAGELSAFQKDARDLAELKPSSAPVAADKLATAPAPTVVGQLKRAEQSVAAPTGGAVDELKVVAPTATLSPPPVVLLPARTVPEPQPAMGAAGGIAFADKPLPELQAKVERKSDDLSHNYGDAAAVSARPDGVSANHFAFTAPTPSAAMPASAPAETAKFQLGLDASQKMTIHAGDVATAQANLQSLATNCGGRLVSTNDQPTGRSCVVEIPTESLAQFQTGLNRLVAKREAGLKTLRDVTPTEQFASKQKSLDRDAAAASETAGVQLRRLSVAPKSAAVAGTAKALVPMTRLEIQIVAPK